MGDFEKAVQLVLGVEGGVSDRPLSEDPGGLTNLGISTRFLQSIGDPRDVRDLTMADAVELYRRHFWNKVKGDDLPDPLAAAVFDHAVNAGPGTAVRLLQTLLNEYGANLVVDGAIGAATLGALQELGAEPEWLAQRYLWLRIRDYANRPSLELRRVNLSGWCNRVCNLEEKLFGEEG
jgi:lysozyme family protein